MPVPNDFRLSGALGGLVASQEYQAEQEKQNLANLLTQAQTAQQTQQTQQAQQLLPFLLQQREQENQIRAKEALAAQLGMRNVPQEVANRGQELTLAGMTNQANLENFDENQKIAGMERKGKMLGLDQANQLASLRKIFSVLQAQGPLAASSAAGELGMNPEVLMQNPEMIPRAIALIENQMMRTPQHLGKMEEVEAQGVFSNETARISADASKYRTDVEKQWRSDDRAEKAEKEKKALDIQKDYVKARNEWLNSGQPTSGPVFDKYEAAHNDYWTSQTYRQPSNSYLDFETGDIRRETPQNRPIPPLINRPKAGSGGGNPTGGSGGNQILSPEQRAELIRRLKESK